MWVARDKDGLLKIFLIKPMRSNLPNAHFWVIPTFKNKNYVGDIDDDTLFPELKWEDEPIEVRLIPEEALIGLYKTIDKAKNGNN